MWVQKTTSVEDTLVGKRVFGEHAPNSGIRIHHYHADNGFFKARAWVDECHWKRQRLTYAGIGAHLQNGVANRRIWVLQDLARAQLAHASQRWPDAVSANIWPHTLMIAINEWNHSPNSRGERERSPAQIFHSTDVQRNSKHSVPLGSRVYVLKDQLQQRTPYHKWMDRARVGMHLGRSTVHTKNMSLVLDIAKGYVSHQYHCTHDSGFDTVKSMKNPEHGQWKVTAGFVRRQRL